MGIFSSIKSSAVSAVAKKFIGEYLQRYGSLLDLDINPNLKQIRIKFLPKGEDDSVTISIEDYKIINDNSKYFFKARKADTSREWLSILLEELIVKKNIEIPEKYYSYIKLML